VCELPDFSGWAEGRFPFGPFLLVSKGNLQAL